MKTIKQLRNEIEETANEPTDYPYGERDILEAQLQTLKDVLKLIDELKNPYAKRGLARDYVGFEVFRSTIKSKIQGKNKE